MLMLLAIPGLLLFFLAIFLFIIYMGRMESKLHYHYIANYPLDLCLEYMKHNNIYDRFEYEWEERGGYYLITFKEYKSSMLSLANAPKPTFKVTFENMGNQTGISVQFIKGSLQPVPFVYTRDINIFWEKKLDAETVQ